MSARPAQQKELSLDAYAYLVGPTQVARYAHLASYRDHVVLGNESLQIVFAPIPFELPKNVWQKSIIAIFQWIKGRWQPFEAVREISLQKLNASGQHFYPIAMDMGQEANGYAFFTVILTDREGLGAKTAVTWRLSPHLPILSLVTSPFQDKSPQLTEKMWKLQLQGLAVLAEKGFYPARVEAGKQVEGFYDFLRFDFGKEAMGLLAYQPLKLRQMAGQSWKISPQPGAVFGLTGYSFFFGQSWPYRLHEYLVGVRLCHGQYLQKDLSHYGSEERFHLMQECLRKLPAHPKH